MSRTHPFRALVARRRLVPAVVVAATVLGIASHPADARTAAPARAEGDSTALQIVADRLDVDPASLTVVAEAITRFAELDLTVTSAKVLDAAGAVHGVAFDVKGTEVDVDGLAAEALAVRRAQFGAVDPALDALLARAPGEPRAVLIWLREPAPSKLPERPEASGKPLDPGEIDRIYADLDARRAEIVGPLVEAVLADVMRFDERAEGLTPTPAIAATLDAKQIAELAGDDRIDLIYDAPVATADLGIAKQTTGVTQVHGTGLDGTGVRVGIVEVGGRTESSSWLMRPVQQNTTNVCANPTQHTTNVTSVIAGQRVNVFGQIVGEDGVSKRADVLVGGSCTGVAAQLQAAATRAADWGARTINLSWGSDSNLTIGAGDRFFDEMVHNRWRTIVKSAGNRNCGNTGGPGGMPDADVTSPGLAYNVVTVGGLDDVGTAQRSDDTMYACSSFGDPTSRNGDREKPELVAPAANIEMVDPGPANLFVDSGTSFAAPHVTGVTALLMQQNSTLTVWPEITRAVLMASATHNIEGSTRLSDQDGAGGLEANRASGIVGNTPAWGGVAFNCSTPHTLDLTTRAMGRRTHHRVAISWTTDPAFEDYNQRPSADIDLQVVDSFGRVVASSSSWDNTTEIVEFDSWTAGTYTVRAINFRCDRSTFLGWAWDTSSMLKGL
ncbi:MAG TPA: S8 family serine peptidase [Ilumatobacteraceae bacterium]|nr:S8 family serine peptidase [Ilumatobacteraceae bacterium]